MQTIQGVWHELSGSENAQAASQLVESDSSAFKFLDLTRTQRMYGFGACILGGFVISLLGAILFTLGQVTTFALLYVIGVIVSLVGTGFLVGFGKQLRMMIDPVRRYAALVFLLCIALVFVFAFAVPIDILVIVFAILTYLAYAWYALSYIPYARGLAKKLWPF